MNLVYRGVAYNGGNNTMDSALITYLMKQKKEQQRKDKEQQRELTETLSPK